MGRLAKIFASCKAGCLWETVHRSEFEKSASHIEQYPQEDGSYLLEVGKEYKIFAPKTADGTAFDCSLIINTQIYGADVPTGIFASCNDKYAKSFVFRLLEFISGVSATLIYELNGVRYSEVVSDETVARDFVNCTLSGATKVLLYNADATITGKQGEKGDKGDTGAKIVSNTYKGQDASGGYIYTLTFDDGSTYDFIIPKDTSHLLSNHPVGGMYFSNDPTSPAELFGGNWLQLKGVFIVAADNDASEGAAPTYNGMYSGGSADAVVVSHSHSVTQGGLSLYNINSDAGAGNGWYIGTTDASLSSGESQRLKTDTVGESGAGKNLPPFFPRYVWERYPDDAIIS